MRVHWTSQAQAAVEMFVKLVSEASMKMTTNEKRDDLPIKNKLLQ